MGFSEIVGQEDAKNLLKNAIKNNNVSHAYIFSGEKGSGKMMLAEAFAKMLQCANPAEDACDQCISCKKTNSHNNPDIIYVTRDEGKANIRVDDIRESINNDIVLKPYENKYKIYIVEEAEKMNQQAQNALLKTIEEPPAYGIIILLTNNHNALLQTILSRCVTIQMKPLSDDEIKATLREKYEIVDYQTEIVASFAQGNMGKAIELTQSESFNEMRSSVTSVIKKASKLDQYEISAEVLKWADYKAQMDQILDLITLWFRDVLLYKATQAEEKIIFKEDLYDIRQQSLDSSYSGLDEIFKQVEQARTRLKSNVNFDLTVELLIQAIKENTR